MVLRCSLLGHDYADPEVERERDRRGSEVVVTETEYEQCTRCGDRHVISENTEVTSLETDASSAGKSDPDDAPSAGESDPDDADGSDHPAVDDEPDPDVTDDAEIIEDVDDASDRERGEWPDSEDVGPPVGAESEPAAWPDDDATARAAVAADDGAAEADATAAGANPEAESGSGTGIESARAAPVPGETAPPEGVPTEFFCPQCDFVAPGDRGSLRPGDICPDCRKGYLSERER